MKPKNLKFPFKWEERVPLISRGVLFVPAFYEHHQHWPKEEWNQLLATHKRIHIEYCSGNGAWIADKAVRFPGVLWIAVEKRFDRVRKIWSKGQNFQLNNLFVVCGEASVFSRYYLEDNIADGVYINFPDPWPKEKHAKNRLIQGEFVRDLARIVKKQGTILIVTDDPEYSDQIINEMQNEKCLSPTFTDPFYITDYPNYGASYFDSLWREKGRTIRYLQFDNLKL